MGVGAQLSVTELRRVARHPVNYPVIVEHRTHGDVQMRVANVSAHGFMVDDGTKLARGDRVIIRLPVIGRIEAYVIWIRDKRAGFQFERILRLTDFDSMINELQPNPRLRRSRRRRPAARQRVHNASTGCQEPVVDDTTEPSSALRIADFRAYLFARLTMTLGQYAMMLVIGWQTYNYARNDGLSIPEAAGQLGLIGLFQFIPLFFLTPFSGLAADRFDRRRLAQATLLLQLGCAVLLAVLTWRETISLEWLFAVAIALGIVRAFNGPAMSALAPNLVPKAILPNAIALSSIAWQVGMVAGPGLGGYLYAIAPALPYAVAAALFTLAIVAMSFIGPVPRSSISGSQHPIAQIVEGLQYVARNKMVLGAITLDLFAVFLAGANALLPVFARDILKVGETGLAQLAMAPAIGAALTAAWFSFRPLRNNVGPKMLWAVAVFGLATIAFAFSTSMLLSLAALFVIGAADMFSVYIRSSLIQLHTPDEKRGRVSAVSLLTISGSNELGDAFSGGLAFLIGPVAALVAGGAGALATVALWSRVFPVLRTTRTFDPPPALQDELPEQKLQERIP